MCGQLESLSVEQLRAISAGAVDAAPNLSVQLDGVPIKKVRRVKSKVFAVALPEDNVFDALCGSNNVPAGIYSPAVDDGFYVLLDKLSAGKHTLKFQAKDSKDKPVQKCYLLPYGCACFNKIGDDPASLIRGWAHGAGSWMRLPPGYSASVLAELQFEPEGASRTRRPALIGQRKLFRLSRRESSCRKIP